MTHEIPLPIRTGFYDNLLALRSFRDRKTRDTILKDLADIEKIANRRDNGMDDVTEIVSAALSRPNGIARLVDWIHYREGTSDSMKRVWKLAPHFIFRSGDEAVSIEQIGELLFILADIEFKDNGVIEACCRNSLPPAFEGLREYPTRLEMIHTLCTHGKAKDATLPRFLDYLAKERKSMGAELHKWASVCDLSRPEKNERRYHLLFVVTEDLRNEPNASNPLIHAQAVIGTDDGNRDHAKPFSWGDAPPWICPKDIGEETKRRVRIQGNQLECRLGDLRPFVEKYLSGLNGDVSLFLHSIEFAFPGRHMFMAADCWRYMEERIGQVFHVTVRIRERLYTKNKFIGIWEAKWRKFQSEEHLAAGENTVWMFDSPDCAKDAIFRNCRPDAKTVLAMAFRSGNPEREQSVAEGFYKAGIPVALVFRKADCDAGEIGKAKNRFAKSLATPLADLQNQVGTMRLDPEFEEHLTLIRDNPYSVPPKIYF